MFSLVELEGFEPSTPCMPCKCSSQLSYTPIVGHKCKAKFLFFYRFEILLFEMLRCRLLLNRNIRAFLFLACLLLTLLFTRLRHNLNELALSVFRMSTITSASLKSNWKWMASKGVLSSQAISIIRSNSSSDKRFCIPKEHGDHLLVQYRRVLLPLC